MPLWHGASLMSEERIRAVCGSYDSFRNNPDASRSFTTFILTFEAGYLSDLTLAAMWRSFAEGWNAAFDAWESLDLP